MNSVLYECILCTSTCAQREPIIHVAKACNLTVLTLTARAEAGIVKAIKGK